MVRALLRLAGLLVLLWSAGWLRGQAVLVWTGNTSTAWGTGSNWDLNAVPGATSIARFNTNTARDPTIGATPASVGRLEFLTGADAKTIGGTDVLTLNGISGTGITNSSGVTQTIGAGVALGAAQTWTTTGTGSNLTLTRTLDLAGRALTLNPATGATIALSSGAGDVISSTTAGGSLIKNGAGTLTFGNVANTFDGGARLNAGTTTIGHNASLGTGTVTLAGGALNATADRTLANALSLAGNSTISGDAGTDFVFSSNAISTTGGTLHVANTSGSGTMSVGFSGAGFTFSRPVAFDDAFGELRILNTSGTQTYSGVISGAGSVLVNAPGGTVAFTVANTFSGDLTLSAGTLSANNPSALGTGTLVLDGGLLTSSADRAFGNALRLTGAATVGGASGLDLTFSTSSITTSAGSLIIDNTSDSGLVSVRFTGSGFNFSRALTFADAFGELRLGNASGTQTFSGAITGGGSVARNAAGGETVLSGANTYSGGTTISAGTLTANNNGALGTGNLTLSGGTLKATSDRTLANNLTLTTTSTIAGDAGTDFIFTSNAITTTNGTLNLVNTSGTGLMSVGFAGAGFTFSRPIALADQFTELRFLNSTGVQTFNNVISGAGSLLVNAAGGIVSISASNTFTGEVDIAAGTLRLGGAGGGTNAPLGTTAAGTTVRNGAALDLNGFSLGTAEALALNGAGVGGTGALTNSGGAATYQGIVTLNTASSIGGTGNITLSAGLAGNVLLTKVGTGTLTLNAASSRTGTTQVDAGTLKLANPTAAGDISRSITLNGGTLDLATNTSVGSYPVVVTDNSTILSDKASANSAGITHQLDTLNLNNGSTLTIGRGGNVGSGTAGVAFDAVTLGATGATFNINSGAALDVAGIAGSGRSFAVAGAGNMTVSGPITTTTGGVTMNGSGTLLLEGNSSYSGATTVNSGTLRLGAAGGGTNTPLGTTAGGTFVNSGGRLDVNGFTLGAAESLSLAGNGGGAGALINSSTTAATWSGAVTLTVATTIGGTGNLNLSGAVTGGGNALIKTGTNTLTFSGTTSNLGATSINAGTISVAGTTSLHTGALSASGPSTTLLIASGGSVVANYASGTTIFAGQISASGGTFQKTGAGTLQFTNSFNAGSTSTLLLSGGTLSLLGAGVTFGTIHITGNTVLDFGGSANTFLSSATLIIDVGVTVTVNNWVSVANNSSLSTVWYATNNVNGVPIAAVNQTGGVLNQIVFSNYTGLTTNWVASPAQNGWFSSEIRPAPEPATYGVLLLSAAAGLVLLRKSRKR